MTERVEKTKSPFDGEIEDETIALSKDELDNILAEAEIVQDTTSPDKTKDKKINEEFDFFEEAGAKGATGLAENEEFDISGEIDELSPEDLEKIELEEGEVEAYAKELNGEFGEDFDLADLKGDAKADDIADMEAEELNIGTELGEEMDIDSYLDTVKSDIDLEAIDLEESGEELLEAPVLGETEELEEGEVHADKAFKEAGIEGTDEVIGLAGTGEGTALDEELADIEEGLQTIEDITSPEKIEAGLQLGVDGGFDLTDEPETEEIKLSEEEEELLSKDFDLAVEGEPESEEVVTISGDELEKMVEGKPFGSGGAKHGGEEQATIDNTLLNDIAVILKFMDSLLEDLPEDKIRDFAKSKYFALYREVFKKLNIA
jgi:pilus assembly protein FimV